MRFGLLIAWINCAGASAFTDSPPPPLPQAGDLLNLQVDLPDKTSFILHVGVLGKEKIDGAECSRLFFHPGNGVPKRLNTIYHVFAEQKTGLAVKSLRIPEKTPIAVESFGSASIISAALEGFPLELLGNEELAKDCGDRRLTIRKRNRGDHFIMEMFIRHSGVEELAVRQKWVAGEKWWWNYERYVHGKKDLSARLWMKPVEDLFSLRTDPRLQVKTAIAPGPLANVLAKLSSATSLNLTLAANLHLYNPDVKHEWPDGKELPAFAWMERIGEEYFANEDWQKTTDGYRLEGTFARPKQPERVKHPVVVPEPKAPIVYTTPERPPAVLPWFLFGGAAAIFLLAMGLVLARRWRSAER